MPNFTIAQKRKLLEFNADPKIIEMEFKNVEDRDRYFDQFLIQAASLSKAKLRKRFEKGSLLELSGIIRKISDAATSLKFNEVSTPIIIHESFVRKMGIDEKNKLWKQIIWIGNNRCLRPMLAPNLYQVMKMIRRSVCPVQIFEIGPCFRREEEGALHLLEFTMANMVALAPDREPNSVLMDIIDRVMAAMDLDYEVEESSCAVYGKTIDVLVNGVEVASGVVGPIPLDQNWGIEEPWAGVGFGAERLLMLKSGSSRIKPFSRSLMYSDGIYLNM